MLGIRKKVEALTIEVKYVKSCLNVGFCRRSNKILPLCELHIFFFHNMTLSNFRFSIHKKKLVEIPKCA